MPPKRKSSVNLDGSDPEAPRPDTPVHKPEDEHDSDELSRCGLHRRGGVCGGCRGVVLQEGLSILADLSFDAYK